MYIITVFITILFMRSYVNSNNDDDNDNNNDNDNDNNKYSINECLIIYNTNM